MLPSVPVTFTYQTLLNTFIYKNCTNKTVTNKDIRTNKNILSTWFLHTVTANFGLVPVQFVQVILRKIEIEN